MPGHGSPRSARSEPTRRVGRDRPAPFVRRVAPGLLAVAIVAGSLRADDGIDLRLRVAWGAGAPTQWTGRLSVTDGELSEVADLGLAADSPGSKVVVDGELRIRQASPATFDGFDVRVRGQANARVLLELEPTDRASPPVRIDRPVTDFLADVDHRPVDERGNTCLIRRAPGDALRVDLERGNLIFAPGERLKLVVRPHELGLEPDVALRLRVHITPARYGQELWATQPHVRADGEGRVAPITIEEIPLPEDEGVYDLVLAMYRRSRIDVPVWRNAPIVERRIQVVVLGDRSIPVDSTPWKEDRVIDPVNPGWRAWAVKLPGISLLPGIDQNQPLTNGDMKTVAVAGATMRELGTGNWQAIPIPIAHPHTPHILEVEYAAHLPQALGISILEPNAAGVVGRTGIDSAVWVRPQLVQSEPGIGRHRIVFWPRTEAPLVLLTNQRRDGPAVFGKIRLLRGPATLPPAFPAMDSERMAIAYLDQPWFAENFAVGGVLDSNATANADSNADSSGSQVLDDWWKYYEGACRLAEYLRYAGYNGATICVAREASGLYPSAIWPFTPKFDSGAFLSSAQDPMRKDVLEMLFRIFDREGLQLIPAVHFSGRAESLEGLRRGTASDAEGLMLVDGRGRRSVRDYNPLDPRVQRFMVDVVDELAERYGAHGSFAGVAVQLAPDSYSILPDASWGMDRRTFDRFRKSLGSSTIESDTLFRDDQLAASWLSWRSGELASLHARMRAAIEARRPGARLWFASSEMFQGRASRRMLQPTLTPNHTAPVSEAAAQIGIDAALYRRMPGVGLLRPQRDRMSLDVNERAVDDLLESAPEIAAYFGPTGDEGASRPDGGSAFFHEPRFTRWPSFDAVSPFGPDRTTTELFTHAVPAGPENRRRWIAALMSDDPRTVFDGGPLLPLGQEDLLRPVLEVFRQLPREPFEPVTPRSAGNTQPLVVRSLQRGDRTCFYLVNDSPWPVEGTIEIEGPADMALEPIGGRSWPPPVTRGSQRVWAIALEPYDLVAAWLTSPRGRVVDWQARLPDKVIPELSGRIRDVNARATAALARKPLAAPINADFDRSAPPGEIPGWRFKTGKGLQVRLDPTDRSGGAASLHVRSEGDVAWVRSEPFPVPESGRLYALVRLKVADPSRQPNLRVVLDDDRDFYWPLSVGAAAGAARLPGEWTEDFLFPFEHLPTGSVQQVRIGFDLMGAGDVWIDDIQLFDMWIQREERNALLIATGLATKNLERHANVTYCRRFLEGYWPQFLMAFTSPSPERIASAPAARAATRSAEPASPRPAAAPPKSTWEQMREKVPKVPFRVPFRS